MGGEDWKRQRRIVEKAFSLQNLKKASKVFVKKAGLIVDDWGRKGFVEDIQPYFDCSSFDVIGLSNFNFDSKALENYIRKDHSQLGLYEYFLVAKRGTFRTLHFLFPILERLPTKGNRQVMDSMHKTKQILSEITNIRRLSEANQDRDLLDMLLQQADEGNISETEVHSNLFLFFLAGSDTTASTLTMCLYYLAIHPNFQERAREECKQLKELSYESYSQLNFLLSFVKEVLRKFVSVFVYTLILTS